jgi:hypothetical protein
METDGTPANYIINGSVTIDASTATNYTAGTDYIAAISLLTGKIASVIGTVTITTTSSTAALDLGQLTYVSSDFEVNGNFDDTASVLSTALSVHVDVNADSFALPNLISASGGVRLDDITTATVSPLTVDIVNLTTGAVTTADGALQFPDAAVNLGAGSPAADTDVKSIIATGSAGLTSTNIEAAGDVTIGAKTIASTVIDGANITLQSGATGSTWGTGSTINATGDIIVNALTIAGSASTMTNDGAAGGGITLGATSVANLTATASGTGTIDASAMEENAAGSSSFSAADVTLTGLVTNTGSLVVLVDTNIQLDVLRAGAGTITAEAASTLNAPLFTTSGAINLKDGTAGVANGANVTVKSVADIADFADKATINSLTVKAQATSLVASTFVALQTLNYAAPAGTGGTQANDLTIAATAVSLTTIDFTGNGGIDDLAITGTGITSLATVGRLRTLTVSGTGGGGSTNSGLDAITIGNTGINGGTAGVVSITHTGISSLDLSGWNWIKNIHVTGNGSMTTMTFPAGTTTATLLTANTSNNIIVRENAISGVFTDITPATESNVFVESSFSGVGLVGAKAWINALISLDTNPALTVTFTLEVDADIADIKAVDRSGVAGSTATAVWNEGTNGFIDIKAELDLLDQ